MCLLYCIAIAHLGSCDEPETPDNGHKVYTGIREGERVTYFCNRGFKLSGDANRTCQSNGQWSGTQPKCNRTFNATV